MRNAKKTSEDIQSIVDSTSVLSALRRDLADRARKAAERDDDVAADYLWDAASAIAVAEKDARRFARKLLLRAAEDVDERLRSLNNL